MSKDEKSQWETHRDKRFKEIAERYRDWPEIRRKAFKRYGV